MTDNKAKIQKFTNTNTLELENSTNSFSQEIYDAQLILKELGLYSSVVDGINGNGTKNALKENTKELIDRGGFGSPTYFFKDSMFFGNDRIQLLEEELKIS